jgi:hypothetical protein
MNVNDLVDEYMQMSKSICLKSMYMFYRAVVATCGAEYLREPNAKDTPIPVGVNQQVKRIFLNAW